MVGKVNHRQQDRKLLLPWIIVILAISAWADGQPNQYGVPIISNYKHSVTGGSEQNWSITQDVRGVLYVGNNDKGVLEYDGVEWRTIPVPNDPYIWSMVTGDDGVVYVGAEAEFGYLAPDRTGNMSYHSLSGTLDPEAGPVAGVYRTYFVEGKVYFCTIPEIYIYDPVSQTIDRLENPPDSFLSFFVGSTLYTSDYGEGLMRLNNQQFETFPGGASFREMEVTGMLEFIENQIIVSTYNNGLFLLDLQTGEADRSFVDPELQAYLKEGVITQIQPLGEEFAIATMYKGVVILNQEGKAKEIITESEGLIDQTVPWIYSRQDMGGTEPVWIANFMGVSKLETNTPFRVFKEDAGFEGFISDIKYFNGRLFISTFSGVYYKVSSPTGTRFIPVPEIQGEDIRELHVFRPTRGQDLLVASSEERIWLIDQNMGVSVLEDRILNRSEDPSLAEEYAGSYLVQDPNRNNIIFTGRYQLVGLEYSWRGWTELVRVDLPEPGHFKMVIDKYGFLWTTTLRSVYRIDISRLDNPDYKTITVENGLPANEKNLVFLDPENQTVLMGTQDGLYRYDYYEDSFFRDTLLNKLLPHGKNLIHNFYDDGNGEYWLAFENEFQGWSEMGFRKNGSAFEGFADKAFLRLANVPADIFYSDPQQPGIWFGKSNELYFYDKSVIREDTVTYQALIRRISIGNDSILFHGANFTTLRNGMVMLRDQQDKETIPEIGYRFNDIEFNWSATFYEQEDALKYSYKLNGFSKDWSTWSLSPTKSFTNLPFGSYTLQVRAMNIYGDVSLPASYSFTILKPWYASVLAILIYILLAGLLISAIIKIYTRRLKMENLRLEGIIAERTAEIRKQKEELTDSIEYASRIQQALLPSDRLLVEHQLEHFILFRPRDIVSGDFYWMATKKGKLIIVVADCTGHGVPGAFMSMLGMTFLDEIIEKEEVTDTAAILDKLRNHVITSLKQTGKTIRESTRDGMDMSLISINLETKEIQFSGAYNPLYLVRPLNRAEKRKVNKGEELDLPRGSMHNEKHLLIQVRADQMPVGITEKPIPFSASIHPYDGYSIYMFTDGYLDQFGGERGKKFMSRNFKKLLLELQSVSMIEQGTAMEKILVNWMGNISQIDDILVMGLRINQP